MAEMETVAVFGDVVVDLPPGWTRLLYEPAGSVPSYEFRAGPVLMDVMVTAPDEDLVGLLAVGVNGISGSDVVVEEPTEVSVDGGAMGLRQLVWWRGSSGAALRTTLTAAGSSVSSVLARATVGADFPESLLATADAIIDSLRFEDPMEIDQSNRWPMVDLDESEDVDDPGSGASPM